MKEKQCCERSEFTPFSCSLLVLYLCALGPVIPIQHEIIKRETKTKLKTAINFNAHTHTKHETFSLFFLFALHFVLNYHFQSFLLLQNVSELRHSWMRRRTVPCDCSENERKTAIVRRSVIHFDLHNTENELQIRRKTKMCDAVQHLRYKKKSIQRCVNWIASRRRSPQMVFINHILSMEVAAHTTNSLAHCENACFQLQDEQQDECEREKSQCWCGWQRHEHRINLWL